jgi:cytoskeletal protein CcmA (bactofilin family)
VGRIVLSGVGFNELTSTAGAIVTLAPGIQVTGPGSVTIAHVVNGGYIGLSRSGQILLGRPGGTINNQGTIVTAGATELRGLLSNSGSAVVSSGQLSVTPSSLIELSGSTLTVNGILRSMNLSVLRGGTLSGSGSLQVDGAATLDAITLGIPAVAAADVVVRNDLRLDSTFTFASQNPPLTLTFDGTNSVTGSGQIGLRNSTLTWTSGSSLTLGPDVIVTQDGTHDGVIGGPPTGGLIVAGELRSHTAGQTLFVNPASLTVLSTGRLSARTGGVIRSTRLINPCTLAGVAEIDAGSQIVLPNTTVRQISGLINLVGGLVSTAALDLQGGTLAGAGTVQADVIAAGTVRPGGVNTPGALRVTGNLTMNSTATLEAELAGLIPGVEHDVVVVDGTVLLAGVLNVSRLASYAPSLGDRFDVITYASRGGAFLTLTGLTLPNNLRLDPQYNPATFRLATVNQ